MRAKTPPARTISPAQFCSLQSHAKIRNKETSELLGVAPSTISAYRSGDLHVPEEAEEKLRAYARKNYARGKTPKMAADKHVDRVAAGIHRLLNDLYPAWRNTKDGQIFTR